MSSAVTAFISFVSLTVSIIAIAITLLVGQAGVVTAIDANNVARVDACLSYQAWVLDRLREGMGDREIVQLSINAADGLQNSGEELPIALCGVSSEAETLALIGEIRQASETGN